MNQLILTRGMKLPIDIFGQAKISVLSSQTKILYFIADEENFYLLDGKRVIEQREGKHLFFSTEKQIIVCSEEKEELRIAVYRMDNYECPQKVKVKVSRYVPLNVFEHEINFIDMISQKIIINIIRHNFLTGEKESLIVMYRIHPDFRLKYDSYIVTEPKYFGEVCMDTSLENSNSDILGYKFEAYDDCVAAFSSFRVYCNDEKIYYKYNDRDEIVSRRCTGRIKDLEKMEHNGMTLCYLEYNEDRSSLKFIYDQTKKYETLDLGKYILTKYTHNNTIYCLLKDYEKENYYICCYMF